ncbi:Hypothetical predicted protein [Olea europaea subsp. europaea]|uniref:Uncharacterized protein n=1 Tax=Olea europaea subsp. europaea TaxID=158383 RepID=A0A8S0SRS1_OLEEU|nr:Hypothetical predicted protein [Olea europaea subsp. europaea]
MDLGSKNAEKQYESGRKIQTFIEEEEEEGDLFEINLEVVNKIPPPQYYWDSYFTTSDTLLANCLLPISDVSRAIPMAVKAFDELKRSSATESMPRKLEEGPFVL